MEGEQEKKERISHTEEATGSIQKKLSQISLLFLPYFFSQCSFYELRGAFVQKAAALAQRLGGQQREKLAIQPPGGQFLGRLSLCRLTRYPKQRRYRVAALVAAVGERKEEEEKKLEREREREISFLCSLIHF